MFDDSAYNYISTSQRSQVWKKKEEFTSVQDSHEHCVVSSIFVVLAIHTT